MPWIIFFQPAKAAFSVVERSESQKARLRLLSPFLPIPRGRPYFLIAVNTTPAPRPFARTLEDRQIVYKPNPAPGNNPVTVGHHFSTVVILPEKAAQSPSWAIPLRIERIDHGQIGRSPHLNRMVHSVQISVRMYPTTDWQYVAPRRQRHWCRFRWLTTVRVPAIF